MKLTHLSATALTSWNGCKARWVDRYVKGSGRGDSNAAAEFGTRIHETLQEYVATGTHLDPHSLLKLRGIWNKHPMPVSASEMITGTELLIRWWTRQDWSNREVVSTEQEWSFPIKTKFGDIPMKFIIDRVDRVDGELEIFDYKSGVYELNHAQLKESVQALTYATACWLNVPTQNLYWVVFDYLRGEPMGVAFRPNELQAFYDRLVSIAEQILETDEEEARINYRVNPECRFCPKILTCPAIQDTSSSIGMLALMTPEEMVEQRVHLDNQIKAQTARAKLIDAQLAAVFEADDTLEHIVASRDPLVAIGYSSQNRRGVDQSKVQKILRPEELVEYAGLSLGELEDKIEKLSEAGDFERAAALKKAIRSGRTKPTIKILTHL